MRGEKPNYPAGMSQMSNPYAALQRDDMLMEQRVSVMAIVALVVAILGFFVCIVPGLAGLGALLGVAALVIISQSDGRVGGRGMAIAAIVIGLIMTIGQIGVAIGVRQAWGTAQTKLFAPMAAIVSDAEAKDLVKVQAAMTKPGAKRLTQAHVDAFADALKDEMGAFKGSPSGMIQLVMAYRDLGPIMQKFQGGGSNDVIPIPVEFEKGIALLAVQVDGSAGNAPGTAVQVPIVNVKIVTPSGKAFLLYPGEAAEAKAAEANVQFPDAPNELAGKGDREGEAPADVDADAEVDAQPAKPDAPKPAEKP
jgi:hypothetical protein